MSASSCCLSRLSLAAYSSSVRKSLFPNCAGRSKGVVVVLVQVPCRSGTADTEGVWPATGVSPGATDIKTAKTILDIWNRGLTVLPPVLSLQPFYQLWSMTAYDFRLTLELNRPCFRYTSAVAFLSQLLRIVIIDLVLSGDNAVVIGMAAHRLEPRQRKAAILIGGGAAVALRILLTAIAAFLLQLQGLQFLGGLLLIWIGFKLLKQEEESHEGMKSAATLRGAIVTILAADFIMSLDNVLGVAGASEGNFGLLIFGLALSMGILMFMGSLVARLVHRLWWLAYVGSAVIAWTGGAMIFEDPIVHSRFEIGLLPRYAVCFAIAIATLLIAHLLHRHRESE